MIEGVQIESLAIFSNEKGSVLRMLRNDSPLFEKFGEVYFSFVHSGVVKGWKKHLRQTQHFAVPAGQIKLVLFDDRPDSPTSGQIQETEIGESNYVLVRIPPQVWYAFEGLSQERALIVNCTDIPHDPNESVSIDIDDAKIPYVWGVVSK